MRCEGMAARSSAARGRQREERHNGCDVVVAGGAWAQLRACMRVQTTVDTDIHILRDTTTTAPPCNPPPALAQGTARRALADWPAG